MPSRQVDRKRRPRGEGSIVEEGEKWIVRLWAGGRRLKRTRASQAEAIEALQKMRARSALGIPLGPYRVAECLDDFLAHGENSRGWAPATLQAYRSAIDSHLRKQIGKRQLVDLSVREVQHLMDAMLAAGHSGRHVGHV